MIGARTKGLLYAVAILIGFTLFSATSLFGAPLFIFLLCIGWLIKNRHNLMVEPEGEDHDA